MNTLADRQPGEMRLTTLISKIVTLLLLLLATPCFAGDTLLSHAVYSGKYRFLTMEAERKLVQDGEDSYLFSQQMNNAIGSIVEKSRFTLLGSGQLQPLHYSYKQKILGATKAYSLDFDWQRKIATFRREELTRSVPLEHGMLDPLLYQLQLQRDLLAGKTALSYRFLKRDKIKHYRFVSENQTSGPANDATPPLVKLHKQPTSSKRETTIWLSPGQHYQMAKLEHREESETISLTLKSYKPSDNLVAWLSGDTSR